MTPPASVACIHATAASEPQKPAAPATQLLQGPHGSNALLQPSAAQQREPEHTRQHQHHYRTSWDSLGDLCTLPLTPWGMTRHVVGESVSLFKLAVRLWSYLGVGYKWTLNFYRLVIYATLLLPGFIQMIAFYFLSPRVVRSVAYGRGPRQRLDLYLPKLKQEGSSAPVVIFITGGAWTIGYKAWGALLGRRLSRVGVLVACLDYRNFPQGNALQMLEDINTGVGWVLRKCGHYGGDPDAVSIVAQSAGGHLAALALLKQAEQAAGQADVLGAMPSWSPRDLRAFVGVSGAYDLEGLAEHLHRRGLYKNLFTQIMSIDGVPALHELSPLSTARSWGMGHPAAPLMPPVTLIHGTADKSVPHDGSHQMSSALRAAGCDCSLRMIEGRTHTSFLLEGPMMGGRDELMELVLPVVMQAAGEGAKISFGQASMCTASGNCNGAAKGVAREEAGEGYVQHCNGAAAGGCIEKGTGMCSNRAGKSASAGGCMADGPASGGTAGGGRRAWEHEYTALCPTVLCQLAGWVCPF